jgi:hypothetical protein
MVIDRETVLFTTLVVSVTVAGAGEEGERRRQSLVDAKRP